MAIFRQQPICQGCGQPIQGRYLTALNATWHPEHFVCAACGRPIAEASFQVHQGAPYHASCYMQQIAPRCVYCGKPLMEKYLIDYWGNYFCAHHQNEYPACAYCGRLVPPQQQEPPGEDAGVVRCPLCRASAIETVEEARPYYTQVKQWVGSQGLVYNNLPLSLDLCGPQRLAELLHESCQNPTHAYGATVSSSYVHKGQVLSSEVKGVAVLRGLPAILFQGITVHELGHVWLVVHGIRPLPTWAEEGFCELLAYRFYHEINTPESRYYITGMEQNPDPIYGAGFRRIRALADKLGFSRFLATMRATKTLPSS
ncbi:MAG: protein DA1 [Ktedonobacteraceae bacterium]|nr:protein DA1 [Ktedonobacteraceae bacterium]